MGTSKRKANETKQVFLVLVDDSPEMPVALRFACYLANKRDGQVALFRALEPAGFMPWAGVDDIMRTEMEEEANELLQNYTEVVTEWTGDEPIVYVREGNAGEGLTKLLREEKNITKLVLASDVSTEDPGPVISYMMREGTHTVHKPIIVVPSNMTDEELMQLA